jgi:hypothetical protein
MQAVKLFSAILRSVKYLFFMPEFSRDNVEQGFLNFFMAFPLLVSRTLSPSLPPLCHLIAL